MTLTMLALIALAVPAAIADPPVAVDPAEEQSQVPALPATPAAVEQVLLAQPFTLDQGYEFEWSAEHPVVSAGWLLVLQVNPDLVFPRQTAEPILYIGNTTTERINHGHQSGRVIAIVPSDVNETGELTLDLNKALMWFGAPGLPEQIDAAMVRAQLQIARNAGIVPLPEDQIAQARAKAPDSLRAADRTALRRAAAELIKVHSPAETELADIILAEQPQPEPVAPPKNDN